MAKMLLRKVALVSFVILVIKCSFCFDDIIFDKNHGAGSCTTPSNRPGTCKKFYQCPTILKVLQEKLHRNDPLVLDYLKKSECFFDNTNLLYVCCEKDAGECTTIEKQVGACIPLERCDPIAQHLSKKPLFNVRSTEYLQYSSCTYGDDKNSRVCCPVFHKNLTHLTTAQPPTPDIYKEPFEEENKEPVNVGNRNSIDLPEPGEGYGNCGFNGVGDRILGGKETELTDFPWMALLQYGNGEFNCGGTLINDKYILTAAHCVVKEITEPLGNLTIVRLGEWDITSEQDCIIKGRSEESYEECNDPPTDIPPEEIITHSGFNLSALLHDIALIRLSKAVNYTDFIRPICLPLDHHQFPSNQKFIVSGWGRTKTAISSNRKLYLDKIPLVNKEKCAELYSTGNKTIGPGQICAGGLLGEDSCTGDSGGPLKYTKVKPAVGSFYYQAGITSFGSKPCGRKDIPAVYTNVEYYLNWIIDNMRP